MPDETVLRRVFPSKSTCPNCGSNDYRQGGSSRSGDIRYRLCTKCRNTYRVLPVGQEIDRGGMVSEIRPW